MKTLTWMVLLVTFLNPAAQADQTRVSKIEASTALTEPTLIYLEDGRLLRIDPTDEAALNRFKIVEKTGDFVDFDADRVGAFHLISHFAVVPAEPSADFAEKLAPRSTVNVDYTPTDLGTYEVAQATFKKLTWNLRRRSQCYQRAENWVYEMWTSSKIYSMKTFMFFTRKYINDYGYDWWFHVTPFVVVAGTQYMMDRTFTNAPLNRQDWTANFMPKNVSCPVVEKYSDYSQHQQDQLCYHIQVPMYYYQPLNVEAMEKGVFVTDWVPWELAHARRAY
jgi:hypothetical protein